MDAPSAAKKIRQTLWLAAGCSVLFFFFLSGCGDKGEAIPKEKKADQAGKSEKARSRDGRIVLSPEVLKSVRVRSEPVTRSVVVEAVEVTAAIIPNQDRVFNVTPRIKGRVVEVHVSVGSRVKKDTPLALLDSTELGEAKAEYVKARTLLGLAKANYERERSLFEQRISARKDMLAAEAEYRKSEAEVQLLGEKLRLYGLSDQEISGLEHSQSPSRYYLRAPAAGIVTDKEITLGEVLETGKKIFVISDLSSVWISLDIYEKDLSKVKVGQKITIRVGAYPERQFVGKVTYISDLMDEKTKTVKARVEIPNPESLLKPGMFAEARIESGAGVEKRLTVPKEALFLLDDGPVVFIEKDGAFFPRRVETGKEVGGRVEIRNGVSENDKAVVEGGYYLKAELLKSQMGED